MASVISIAIAARSTAAAALARTRAQIAATNTAIRQSSFVTRQHTRTVHELVGVYRDASGQWYDARGNMVASAYATRTVTTAYGRLHDAIQRTTRALIAYTIASRMARNISDGTASMLTRMGMQFAMIAVKVVGLMAVLFPLIGVLGNLIPLVQLVAPAAGTAALMLVGLKLAFNGVSDALQAGLTGDTEAFEKALKKLPKSAADTIRTLVRLRDTWKPLQQEFQSRVFEGAAGELASLSNLIKPVADKWLPKLASRFAETRNELANGLANFAADGRLEGVWRNLQSAASAFLSTIKPMARVFGDVLEVAAPRFAALADTIAIGVKHFADWIRQAKESGDLGRWLDKAMETFGKLRDIAENFGKVLGAIFKASGDDGDSMLDSLVQGTERLAEWANGESGQNMINIISSIVGWLSQVGPALSVVTSYMEAMGVFWSALWDGLKAIFRGVVAWILGGYDLLLKGAAKAFGWIPGLGDKLKAAQSNFEEFKNSVNRSLDGIEDEVVNITYRAVRVGNHTYSGSMASGSYSSGIGGVAAGGPGGSPKQINEWGHEIVDFTKGMVYNANQSKRMMAAMAGGGGGAANVNLSIVRGRSVGNPLAQAVLELFHRGDLRFVDASNRPIRPA